MEKEAKFTINDVETSAKLLSSTKNLDTLLSKAETQMIMLRRNQIKMMEYFDIDSQQKDELIDVEKIASNKECIVGGEDADASTVRTNEKAKGTTLEAIVMDQQYKNCYTGRPIKRLYTFIKQQKTDSREINSLKSNGISYTLPTEKANILNTQFQSVFTKLVPLKLRHLVELVLPRKLSSPSMQNITISVSGVSKQLLKLNPGKEAGPDNVSPRILKELHNEIVPILLDIFNTSLSEGIIPDDWKNAFVTPVFKKGPKCKPENYRPI